jgi:hypothetical protein
MAKAKADNQDVRFTQQATAVLNCEWDKVVNDYAKDSGMRYVADAELATKISQAVNHKQVAYRFLLPIQLLGKVTEPSLDCRSMQAGANRPGAWNARTLGSEVVAPWNARQAHVLGTSTDPYVGNPARRPMMTADTTGLKDKAGWLMHLSILNEVETRNDYEFTLAMFRQVLLEVIHRQQDLTFTYAVPARLSLPATLNLCNEYLAEKSGGDRALSLAGALFAVVGRAFGLFASVRRGEINAADRQTGMAGDLECVAVDGRITLMVEVKDRKLTIQDFEGTLLKARSREIKEIFILAHGVEAASDAVIRECATSAYATGENVYVFDFLELARSVLALGSESLRRAFVVEVGVQLDKFATQPMNRLRWKQLLESV